MIDYLQGAITENIRRAELLKKRIPSPVPIPELLGVVESCNSCIDNCLAVFNEILNDNNFGNPRYLAGHLRQFRKAGRILSIVEQDGLPALVRFSEDEEFMSRLIFKIHQEIRFPLLPPIAACFAYNYYQIQQFLNVIYVPLLEGHCLLHLPDLLHEMGHLLIHNIKDARVKKFRVHYERNLKIIDDYYNDRIKERKRGGPKGYLGIEFHIRNQWIEDWAKELVCDLFATFVLGPAYAWAHFHLASKESDNLYRFSHQSDTTHPADDARMQAILVALKIMNFNTEAKEIQSKWDQLPPLLNHNEDPDYHLAYPSELIERFVIEIHQGITKLGCKLAEPGSENNNFVGLLNEAWIQFWKNPQGYADWEEKQVKKWRKKLITSKA